MDEEIDEKRCCDCWSSAIVSFSIGAVAMMKAKVVGGPGGHVQGSWPGKGFADALTEA
jgi:hypothetical protein